MSNSDSKALVPLGKVSPPALRKEKVAGAAPLDLVSNTLRLSSREDVRNLLPDILGKVLARVWLDRSFHRQFSQDPQLTLEKNGVFLPENMSVEFQKQDTDRPRIVVYEQKPGSKFKLRVFYLQLVMMAGR
jgi:hypothetical protein